MLNVSPPNLETGLAQVSDDAAGRRELSPLGMSPDTIGSRRFPVRIKLAIPAGGLGTRLTEIHAWPTTDNLMRDYFISMAQRVYGNNTAITQDTNAAILARWTLSTRPGEVHIRHLQREVRLPGLRTAEQIRKAADLLVAADWLCPPAPKKRFGPRARLSYRVNPRLRTDDSMILTCPSGPADREPAT